MADDPAQDDTDERIERKNESPDDAEAKETAASGEGDVEDVPDGERDLDEETDEWLDEEEKRPDDRE